MEVFNLCFHYVCKIMGENNIIKDPTCLHQLRFRSPYQDGMRLYSRDPSKVPSPPSLKALAFLAHDWTISSWSWAYRRSILRTPTSSQWGGFLKDFTCTYRHHSYANKVFEKNLKCKHCLQEKQEFGKKVLIPPYQSPFLPTNYLFFDKNCVELTQYWDYDVNHTDNHLSQSSWFNSAKELRTRRLDFHGERSGIIATTLNQYLPSLQTISDMRNVLHNVSVSILLHIKIIVYITKLIPFILI